MTVKNPGGTQKEKITNEIHQNAFCSRRLHKVLPVLPKKFVEPKANKGMRHSGTHLDSLERISNHNFKIIPSSVSNSFISIQPKLPRYVQPLSGPKPRRLVQQLQHIYHSTNLSCNDFESINRPRDVGGIVSPSWIISSLTRVVISVL